MLSWQARNLTETTVSIAKTASEITLPPTSNGCSTVFDFLCQRFPNIGETIWRERMAAGKVHWHQGELISEQTPFLPSRRVCYYREVTAEPVIPFAHRILYQDEHILIADKPHFLPVTPGGDYVNECLLARLKRDTGLDDLVPVHRLDRDTAGLVLFSLNPKSRPGYYQLFVTGSIQKQYQAVARLTPQLQQAALPQRWHIENRIEKANPGFINRIAAGEPNARSTIALTERSGELGLFQLQPHTGKTHQLRLHMLSLGVPILYDRYYPELFPKQAPNFSQPLQLLAKQLSFTDPTTGEARHFVSGFELQERPS
ncbi:pseudouridine synthase [Alkalimonas sp. MEB108]|uniref:Pseudouridine synthase n=1 Tax=Alkalimonas cellulosilytica TaxID=3058395 RepID=A0ABU7J651_9GAMM|nr:pseudouridine synthase [Alkalimonas sp. MEB108]MEE2001986.1 pseudouridine synthase [Alkalimonas sp. MEB108]